MLVSGRNVLGEVTHRLESDFALVDKDDDGTEEPIGIFGDIRCELGLNALHIGLALHALLDAKIGPTVHFAWRPHRMH